VLGIEVGSVNNRVPGTNGFGGRFLASSHLRRRGHFTATGGWGQADHHVTAGGQSALPVMETMGR